MSTHTNGDHLDVGNARINGDSLDVGNVFEDTTQLVEDPLIAMIPENIVENHKPYIQVYWNICTLCIYTVYIYIWI